MSFTNFNLSLASHKYLTDVWELGQKTKECLCVTISIFCYRTVTLRSWAIALKYSWTEQMDATDLSPIATNERTWCCFVIWRLTVQVSQPYNEDAVNYRQLRCQSFNDTKSHDTKDQEYGERKVNCGGGDEIAWNDGKWNVCHF